MLVGEAPGENEDNEGEPFIGRAGHVLDECLETAGLSRRKVYITNAVKCRPPDNRDPTPDELGSCFRYLADEIDTVKPKVIIAVGRWAIRALTGNDSVARTRGKLLDPLPKIRVGNAKIIATFHPANYLYSHKESVKEAIVEDLRSAKRLANPKASGALRQLLVEGYQPSELQEALDTLTNAKKLACDLEWLKVVGKESISWPWTPGCSLLSISLTGRIEGRLQTVAASWPSDMASLRVLRRWLKGKKLSFHNASADVIWLLSQKIIPLVAGDSMLASYLLDEQRRAGLKGLAPLVAGAESGWEQKPWHRRPASRKGWLELLTYNADDTENTLRLDESLMQQLNLLEPERQENLKRVYRKLLLRAVVPFAKVALAGTPISLEALGREIQKHTALKRSAIQDLAKIVRIRADAAERLAGSPQQVTRFAQDAFSLEVDGSNEEALRPYVKKYPALGHIQDFKHERKMLTTYLEPWKRLLVNQGENRLHSIYLLGATRTGRLSAEVEEGGSLLLVPRDEWARDLISADDGWEIHSADYSQIELRMIAWLAPERNMRKLYREGADLHQATAAFIKGLGGKKPWTVEQFWPERAKYMALVTKAERQGAKGVNFGLDFGMQKEHLASYCLTNYGVDMSDEQADIAHQGYFQLYDDLNPWHERCKDDFYRGLPTLTPFGRYRFDIAGVPEQINTPIQSTASDLGVFCLGVVTDRLFDAVRYKAQVIGFIHDCLMVHAHKSVRKEVREIIKTTMEHPPLGRVGIGRIPVPLVADLKTGKTWAKAS